MVTKMERKILVALDGSSGSINTGDYIGHVFGGVAEMHFHLFRHIRSPCQDVKGKTKDAVRYLENVRSNLIKQNIPADKITVQADASAVPAAKVILHTVEKGLYDSVLVGRRGLGVIGEMFMGSVSADLYAKCHRTPLWLLDGKVKAGGIMVPVDGSVHSLLAVDHLAHIFHNNPNNAIYLFHSTGLFGAAGKPRPADFHQYWDKEWCAKHIEHPNLLNAPRQLLIESGFPTALIHTLPQSRHIEPGLDILGQANDLGCSTIVVGRRGMDVAKGLFKRVSDRILFKAKNMAVWIVG